MQARELSGGRGAGPVSEEKTADSGSLAVVQQRARPYLNGP